MNPGEDELMRQLMGLPCGFGKSSVPAKSTASSVPPPSVKPAVAPIASVQEEEGSDDNDVAGPMPLSSSSKAKDIPKASAKASAKAQDDTDTDDDDSEEEEEEEDPLVDLPLSHQVALKSHSKVCYDIRRVCRVQRVYVHILMQIQ
jgi:hypothetical protein